jgi:hypothetical protein
MNNEVTLLDFIKQHWSKNHPAQLERGVWVAMHEPMSIDEDEPHTPVCKTWLITDRGTECRQLVSFKLFAENKLKVKANESHEMGEANIAPYQDGSHYYIDFLMGPLRGGAMKAEIIEGKVFNRGRLWSA